MALPKRRHVLIVDRDPDHRALFAEIFRYWNFTTVCVGNEREAMTVAACERFDLLVVDIEDPQGDKHALVQQLRDQNEGVPFLAMSSWGSGSDWAKQIGADAFLAKPFNLDDLKEIVTQLCPDL